MEVLAVRVKFMQLVYSEKPMFLIYFSEHVCRMELGFKQILTLQTSVIPVVPTQLFISLEFYKFSRMLPS